MMLSQEEFEAVKNEARYTEFVNGMERLLKMKIIDDLTESGIFTDDEFGSLDWNQSVMLVTESMTRTLWDSYSDNIGYIIDEELR
jgi:hypothetical protein